MDRSAPSGVVAAAEARRRRLVEGTLGMLREAAAAGYKDIKRLPAEPAFATVRSSREFEAIPCGVGFPADAIAGP
jgi:hypothetical protein